MTTSYVVLLLEGQSRKRVVDGPTILIVVKEGVVEVVVGVVVTCAVRIMVRFSE